MSIKLGLGVHRNEDNVFLLKEPEFRSVHLNKVATNPIGYMKLMK